MKEIEYFKKDKYTELGFRCGLEIHQQLDTKTKLFCNCPVGLTPETPNMKFSVTCARHFLNWVNMTAQPSWNLKPGKKLFTSFSPAVLHLRNGRYSSFSIK